MGNNFDEICAAGNAAETPATSGKLQGRANYSTPSSSRNPEALRDEQQRPQPEKEQADEGGASPSAESGSIGQPAPAKAPEKSTKKPLLDLAKYRGATKASADAETAIGTQTNIPVRKPGSKNFFRVHPDPSYRLYDVRVIEEDGGDIYLLDSELELPSDVLHFVSRVNLLVALTHRGKLFVWHFKNTDTSWASSALRVARRAQDEWVRIHADFESGGYNIFTAPEPLYSKKPVFPKMSPEEIFTLAFDNRRLTSTDDPIIRRLRALE